MNLERLKAVVSFSVWSWLRSESRSLLGHRRGAGTSSPALQPLVERGLGLLLDLLHLAGVDQLLVVEVLDGFERLRRLAGSSMPSNSLQLAFGGFLGLAVALGLAVQAGDGVARGRGVEGDFLAVVGHINGLAVLNDVRRL